MRSTWTEDVLIIMIFILIWAHADRIEDARARELLLRIELQQLRHDVIELRGHGAEVAQ